MKNRADAPGGPLCPFPKRDFMPQLVSDQGNRNDEGPEKHIQRKDVVGERMVGDREYRDSVTDREEQPRNWTLVFWLAPGVHDCGYGRSAIGNYRQVERKLRHLLLIAREIPKQERGD